MTWEPFSLLEALDESVCVLAADSTMLYVNAASARLAGVERDQLIGQQLWALYPDADPELRAAFDRAVATGTTEVVDAYYAPWGRWLRTQIYKLGDVIHMITRDITAQRVADARLEALAAASQAFARVIELEPLFQQIASTLAEYIGDACIVRVIEGEHLRPVAISHSDPGRRESLEKFFARPLAVDEGLSAQVLRTGQPLLIERVDNEALRSSFQGDDHRAGIERKPPYSVAAIALSDGDEKIGMITMLRDSAVRPYSQGDLSLLQDLAERAGMAITRARLYATSQLERKRAISLAAASRAFSDAELDTRATLALLARTAANEIGEVAVATVISEDGTTAEPVAFAADRELAAEIEQLLTRKVPLAGSMTERMIASGKPLRIGNVDIESFARSALPKYSAYVHKFQPKSFLLVPIKRGDRVIGALNINRQVSAEPYTEDDEQFIVELCDRAALAIENGQMLDAERFARQSAERVGEQTRRLQAIGAHLSHRRAPHEVAETILRESATVLGGATGAIWLLDESGRSLDMLASFGYAEPARYARFSIDNASPLCAAVRTGKAFFVGCAAEYTAQFPESARRVGDAAPGEFATACLPLFAEGRAIGGIAFAFAHAHPFIPDERTFLEVLASQCAQAIDRARLLEQERAASAALAETNRTLNAVIQASPAAIIMADLHGVIRIWNPAAERMFGFPADEVVGRLPSDINPVQRDEIGTHLARVATGAVISGVETRRCRRDGTEIDVALWAAPVPHPDGDTRAIAVFVDITDRKRAEEAARAADARKDEFLAMLGHELRNPLAPILTALELMRMRGERGAERERAMIERQTRHLVRLVDDLLDISRITRGKVDLRKARLDLGAVINHAVEMASPLLEQRNHHVSIAAPRGHVFVDGDEIRLAQVFHNLLTNSAKYTPSGGSITVRLTREGDHGCVEVEDNGEGIAADVLPTIFEPFVQGARKIDRSQGGLGIGLTLVRSLTQLHGGEIEAHSDGPGQGSRFLVRLPLAADALREVQRTPQGIVPLNRARRRVLLVDDNRDAAEMLAELLRAAGHEVMVAFDGPSALGSVPTFQPDVALLDIGLPVMDGYDLARKLKDVLPSMPRLVAITGYGQDHDQRRSIEAGFVAHLVKPVQAAQVLAAVDEPTS